MRVCLFAILVCLATAVTAQSDVKRGEAAYVVCATCHGAEAAGNRALAAPALANLDADYISRQLLNFRSGRRGGAGDSATAIQMRAMAAVLADEGAVADVSAYISSLPKLATVATVDGDPAAGQSQYNMICGACHGGRAEGNGPLQSPALAGVDDWYLLNQLNAFRTGTRGSHKDDRLGRQMRSMAAVITSDKAARDVVAYIHSMER
ncbi:MAG: cytochrome c553 [Halieaceae bacterium]|jgi:cytochrome c553